MLVIPLYFSHLFAFLACGLTVAAYEFGRWLDADMRSLSALAKRAAEFGAPFLIPVCLLAFLNPDQHGVTSFGSVGDKLTELASPTRFFGSWFDVAPGTLIVPKEPALSKKP